MAPEFKDYREARNLMKDGDVIAFSGKGDFSEIIKWATRSNVSHVGVILQSKLLIEQNPQEGYFNQIIESTTLNGFSGVRRTAKINASIYLPFVASLSNHERKMEAITASIHPSTSSGRTEAVAKNGMFYFCRSPKYFPAQ